MSFVEVLFIRCDFGDCENKLRGMIGHRRNLDAAAINDHGWLKYYHSHFCPNCKEQAAEKLGIKGGVG
mgnify:CR=1 FL=1